MLNDLRSSSDLSGLLFRASDADLTSVLNVEIVSHQRYASTQWAIVILAELQAHIL